MKRYFLLSTFAAIGLLFTACKKSTNNTATPYQPAMSYELLANNSTYSVPNAGASASVTTTGSLAWTSGTAYPDVIKFEATQGNLQVDFKSTNNGPVDLLAPVALAFGNFTLPAGTYDKITLKIDLDRNGTSPVLQLDGTFTNNSVALPVEILVTQSVELKTTESNVTITTDNSYLAVTTIDLSTITTGITTTMLGNAQLTGGTIVISHDSNRDLYNMVLGNLEGHTHHCEVEHHHH